MDGYTSTMSRYIFCLFYPIQSSSTTDIQAKEKAWSWFAGAEKPGVFEIDWQRVGDVNRIALALECRQVGVIDVAWIPALQDYS
jgi:hypothetical protein